MKSDKLISFSLVLLIGVLSVANVWAQALAPGLADKYGLPKEEVVSEGKIKPGIDEKSLNPSPQIEQTEQAGSADDLISLSAVDVEIKDLIKLISKTIGINFLIDDKIRGKVTIISENKMTKEMAYQAFLSALQVMGFTPVQTPGGLVKIVQTKEAINQPIDIYKNETPITDKFITRIVQVKNISANDLSSVIKGLVSKDGNLFAYPQTNSIIITDSGSNIDRILQITRELDQEGPQEVIEIIPIINADAKDITEKILELYEKDITGSKSSSARPARRGRQAASSGELEDAPSISKVISDERTNSVIVLGSKRAIIKVRALISRLDANVSGTEGSIHVYYLKHATAEEMSSTLSSLISGVDKKSSKSGDKSSANSAKAATGNVQLESDVKVTADESTNSLVITASPKDYETLIEKVVSKLDIPRRQVYLEAVIMDLKVSKQKNLGLSGNFGSLFGLGGESLTAFGSVLPGFASELSTIATATGGLAGGAFSDRTISFTGGDGQAITIPAVSAIIHALQNDSDANILSTPSILTLDNEEAAIQVGEEVPVKSGTSLGTGGIQNFNVTREDTGVILKVTPQISESDTVRLKISQEVSKLGVFTEDGPIFSKRTVDTVVVANDKQTVVIGGLIEDENVVTTGKVPYLGDIPVLGNLFKNRQTSKTKSNILVFITPYIIRDRSDYMAILQKKIEERNMFIDMNYGVSQRKQIRESIKTHAKDLLEYKGTIGVSSSQPAESSPTVAAPSQVVDKQEPAKYNKSN